MKEKILFITNLLPYPLDNGGKIKTYNTIKMLSDKYCIDLVCFSNDDNYKMYIDELLKFCSDIKVIPKEVVRSKDKILFIKTLIKSLFSSYPYTIYKFKDTKMKDIVNDMIKNNDYQYIYSDHLCMAQYADGISNVKKILDQHNCESLIIKRYIENEKILLKKSYAFLEYIKLKNFEKKMCNNHDKLIILSKQDQEEIKKISERAGNILPIVVDNLYKKKNHKNKNVTNILFLGTLSWFPNDHGVSWFYHKVYPKLKKEEFQFYIVGSRPSKQILGMGKEENIFVTGYVDDVNEYIEKCDVMVVPLFIGGGMRVKILEALSKGIPIITTSIGCEGIKVKDKKHILIANNEEEFISKLNQLSTDKELYNILIKNGMELINAKYSFEAVQSKLMDIMESQHLGG